MNKRAERIGEIIKKYSQYSEYCMPIKDCPIKASCNPEKCKIATIATAIDKEVVFRDEVDREIADLKADNMKLKVSRHASIEREKHLHKEWSKEAKKWSKLKELLDKINTETLAPLCYEILERYEGHNLAEHEDRQDIGWATAEAIIEQMREQNEQN